MFDNLTWASCKLFDIIYSLLGDMKSKCCCSGEGRRWWVVQQWIVSSNTKEEDRKESEVYGGRESENSKYVED